jgi:hypothetical protein
MKTINEPAKRATDLERGGNPDLSGATPLWIDPAIQSAVAVPKVGTLPAHSKLTRGFAAKVFFFVREVD